ncbi:MAG: D-alanyl-D-alanine carboxypeptidase [Clostridia bacterium]|nr:D-alanyl-D-alanine carboxypeptidase [Clostridia bacterium]
MKVLKTKILVIIMLFLTILCLTYYNGYKSYAIKSTNKQSKIVIEKDSKRILYQDNAYEKKPMASTTKILTAITVIENCDIEEIITVSKDTTNIEGSSIYLEEGEKLSVSDLLYGLMLRSGNDCAETLAKHCSGSVKDFAELMNKTAKKIGATDSNFTNPHGLHDENHYTTAYDLALISSYAMNNETFRTIVSTKRKVIPNTNKDFDRVLINKNKMLSNYEGATGIKTGYTKVAGRCLVSSAKRDDMELICVVLNCPNMFEDSSNFMENAFSNYKNYNLYDSENVLDFIDNYGKKVGLHVKNDIIIPLTEIEYKAVKIEYDYPKSVDYELKNDEEIGKVNIYCQNNLIFQEKIYTIL